MKWIWVNICRVKWIWVVKHDEWWWLRLCRYLKDEACRKEKKQEKTWESDLLTWNHYCTLWRKQTTIFAHNITFNDWALKKCIIEFSNTQLTNPNTSQISDNKYFQRILHSPRTTNKHTTKTPLITHHCLCLPTNRTYPHSSNSPTTNICIFDFLSVSY